MSGQGQRRRTQKSAEGDLAGSILGGILIGGLAEITDALASDRVSPRRTALGKVGSIVQPDPVMVPVNAGYEFTFTPSGAASRLHTTVRVWTEAELPAGDGDPTENVTCALDPLSEGRDRGWMVGRKCAADVGWTVAGGLATVRFAWNSSAIDPDPVEFFIEIVSSPI